MDIKGVAYYPPLPFPLREKQLLISSEGNLANRLIMRHFVYTSF